MPLGGGGAKSDTRCFSDRDFVADDPFDRPLNVEVSHALDKNPSSLNLQIFSDRQKSAPDRVKLKTDPVHPSNARDQYRMSGIY